MDEKSKGQRKRKEEQKMGLANRDFEKILQLGIDLTVVKNRDKLLESIVENGMEITKCDGGTLYLYEDRSG